MGAPRLQLRRAATFASLLALVVRVSAADVHVADAAGFRAAVAVAKPGTRILLAGGTYRGGFHFVDLRGEAGRPIVIAAADPAHPPVFTDGNNGLHLSNPAHVELSGLTFTKLAHNGLNLDDGNRVKEPESARGITLRGLRISDIGGDGNHDGIKLSGLWDFQVLDCTIERWGTKGGSAIDMVGCHRGLIAGNVIRHNQPEPPNCTGVQGKGGTSDLIIRRNRFEHAGGRGVNIGGGTGLPFFRPPLVPGGAHAEARNIRVEGNTFVGAMAAVAFAGVDGAVVRFNTIERPARWALRILQENKAPGFVACRNGQFTDNVIVFDSSRWSEGGVNVGAGTAPETFGFARNWWYCADQPDRSRPRLPTPEQDGVYGRPVADARGVAGAEAWRE
ncbi:MAG: right-handed parallel beta-helix repeat-containing protein [Opitutaceae bacterium]|nr:right-handed parallel beta-helix repeat-containing protein [Opitutaceae bacterium]